MSRELRFHEYFSLVQRQIKQKSLFLLFDFDLVLELPADKYPMKDGETGGLKKNPKAIGRSVKYIVFFLELFFFFCGEL